MRCDGGDLFRKVLQLAAVGIWCPPTRIEVGRQSRVVAPDKILNRNNCGHALNRTTEKWQKRNELSNNTPLRDRFHEERSFTRAFGTYLIDYIRRRWP